MRLRLSRSARADLGAIGRHIAIHDRAAALRWIAAARQTLETVSRWPYSGRMVEKGLFRLITVRHFTAYLVLWQVQEDCVEIKRVFHGHLDHERVIATMLPDEE